MAYTLVRFIFRQDGQPSVEQGSGTAPTTSTPETATGWVRPAGSQIIGVGGAILGDSFIFDGTDWDQQLNDDSTFSDAADALDNVTETVTAPDAQTDTAIHAAYASGINVNFPGVFTNPDVPRNVKCVFSGGWDGGDITITGTDMADAACVETIADTPGATVAGSKVFKTVTAAVCELLGAGGQTCSIGSGVKLGISGLPAKANGQVTRGGVDEPCTWDITAQSVGITPTNLPDGAKDYVITYQKTGSTTTVTATP